MSNIYSIYKVLHTLVMWLVIPVRFRFASSHCVLSGYMSSMKFVCQWASSRHPISCCPCIPRHLYKSFQTSTITLDYQLNIYYNTLKCYHNGRRFVLLPEDCDLCLHRNPLMEIFEWRILLMLTIESLIAVISLCATFFSLGYSFGRNSKTQK